MNKNNVKTKYSQFSCSEHSLHLVSTSVVREYNYSFSNESQNSRVLLGVTVRAKNLSIETREHQYFCNCININCNTHTVMKVT